MLREQGSISLSNDESSRTQEEVIDVLSAAAECHRRWPRTALSNSG
jgi:hypothetical protein